MFGGLGPGVLGSGVRVIMRDSRSARRASNDALSAFIASDRRAFRRRSMARAVSRVKIVCGLMVLSLGREAEVSLGSRFLVVSFFLWSWKGEISWSGAMFGEELIPGSESSVDEGLVLFIMGV